MENAVDITRLVKSIGRGEKKVVAVNGIDLTIPRGQIVSLLGPNGAGKTTLNDIILGLTTQTSGTISVLGKRPAQAVNDSQVSALLQSDGFRYDMSVEEVVRYIAAAYPHKVETTALMERTELFELRSRKVAKLSGGELQRLRFTLAMIADPELSVLDEPTAGMDVRARKAFWETMRAEAFKGRTVIFATHYLNEAEEFADRIVLMNKGSIITRRSIRSHRRQEQRGAIMTMIGLDFRTYMRNPETLFFTIGLPLGLYLIFGVAQEFGEMRVGHGNVNAAILVNMSLYSGVLAVVGYAGTAAVEKIQGWGRQLALTPMSDSKILRNRIMTSMLVCLAPLVVLLAVGFFMGARADDGRLFISFALIVLLASSFTLYGLGVIARYPVTGGTWTDARGSMLDESLTFALVNYVGWLAIFGLLALWALRRSRAR